MARCDFANARLAALRSRFLGLSGVRELLARPSLEARLDLLRASTYGPAVPPPGSGGDPVAAVESGLAALHRRELLHIAADLEGRVPRRLLDAWLALDAAEALKTVFRGLARAEPVDRILSLAEPAPGLGWEELRALASASSAAEGVARLAAARSPFAPAAGQALAGLGRPGGAARLEVALDRVGYAWAQRAARGCGEDRRVLSRLVSLRADLANAATLLKLEGTGPRPSSSCRGAGDCRSAASWTWPGSPAPTSRRRSRPSSPTRTSAPAPRGPWRATRGRTTSSAAPWS